MAQNNPITTRETLKQYCLRALGKPVIEINVEDDQVEDRIDEALQYFAQYHYDGVERMYLKYEVQSICVCIKSYRSFSNKYMV